MVPFAVRLYLYTVVRLLSHRERVASPALGKEGAGYTGETRRRWAAAQRRKKLGSCNCYPFDIKHLPPTMIPSASQKVNVFPKPALEAPAPSFGSAPPQPPCKGLACLVKPVKPDGFRFPVAVLA